MRIPFVLLFLLILAGDCKKAKLSHEKELLKIWITDRDGNFKIPLHGTGCEHPGIATVLNPEYLELATMEHLKLELEISPGAKSDPEAGSLLDFAEPRTLKVVAEDGSDTTYQIAIGYVEGLWHWSSGATEPMKFQTYCLVWTAEELIGSDFEQLVLGFGGAQQPDTDANGFLIWKHWPYPDTITSDLVFDMDSLGVSADFRMRTNNNFIVPSPHYNKGKLVFTKIERQFNTVSGFWQIDYFDPTGVFIIGSTGSFRNVYLDTK